MKFYGAVAASGEKGTPVMMLVWIGLKEGSEKKDGTDLLDG
jgi:hypothetical protein